MDYAYKICLKRALEKMIEHNIINPEEIKNMYVFADEHSTATNGHYELREGLEQEFRLGTYNMQYSKFFPPLFRNLECLSLRYCNSNATTLIRAADIIANRLYHLATTDQDLNTSKIIVTVLP